MNTKLEIISSIFALLVIFLILYLIRKEKINIKYAIIWLLLFGILAMLLIIPGFLKLITKLLGFHVSSNMIFAIIISVLVIISISLTAIVSTQDRKIRRLIQEVSILKNKNGVHNAKK